jgi:HD-GYP domain-containing protein (c-di-GMP phosphodiesterase class II)
VPLRLLGRPWGVLALGGKVGGGVFTEAEARWLAELAGQVTLVLENLVLFDRLARLHRGAIRALARAIEAKDPYTHGHSERVAAMAVTLGRGLGLGEDELEVLEYAGWLHDVGKIGVPERVLCKPGGLSAEEWALVRAHPELGVRILEPVRELARVLPVVRHHHERYDGAGYPSGLKGEGIPVLARIVHLVDALDAMTSDRAYRRALEWREALEELLRHRGRQFDARMVEKAVSLARELEGRRYGSE